MENEDHENGDHDRVAKKESRSDSRIHKKKTAEQGQSGNGEQDSQDANIRNVFFGKPKVLAKDQEKQGA